MIALSVRRHALGWLFAANTVGVLLAALLLWPEAGAWLGPLSYGRWMPLHLNWQLYGWCSLPLVGALLAWCLVDGHPRAARHARVALGAWSLALALGGVSWLAAGSGGKLFLDWQGWARPLLPLAMIVLWTVVAAHGLFWQRAGVARVVALVGLLVVPSLLYWSAGREVYPAVNPDSGGATGASLLGSTLGIVLVFGMLPAMLGVSRRPDAGVAPGRLFWTALAGSFAVFGLLDRGNASHHAAGQIVGLGLLIAWVPLAWVYFRGFAWPMGAWRWLAAAFGWWALLVVTGWITFLPGVSERLKFTDGLVAHAHLAMAGLVTAMGMVILHSLASSPSAPAPKSNLMGYFWVWQGATLAHVAALLVAGWAESTDAGGYFRGEDWSRALYAGRLLAGGVMWAVSAAWLREAWRKGGGVT
ncbi:MAG: hypothetical protein ABII82_00390 [Verrucomicrobiota bacterium]